MKRRKLWLILPFLLLTFFVFLFQQREPSLLARATLLRQMQPDAYGHLPSFFWLSDHQLLFLNYTEASGYTTSLLDTNTKKETLYKGKGTFFGDLSIDDTIFRLSTDGKKLLWVNNYEVIATDRNGTKLGHWQRQLGQAMYVKEWMQDSTHWIEGIEKNDGTYAKIHGIGEPSQTEQKIDGLGDGDFLGFTNRKTLLTMDGETPFNASGQYELIETPLDGKTKPRHIAFPFSHEVNARRVALSPKGDKLAWVVVAECPPSRMTIWLARLRRANVETEKLVSLWMSDIDGRKAVRKGYFGSETFNSHELPTSVEWLPDGKRVSFCYKNTLYVVNAE